MNWWDGLAGLFEDPSIADAILGGTTAASSDWLDPSWAVDTQAFSPVFESFSNPPVTLDQGYFDLTPSGTDTGLHYNVGELGWGTPGTGWGNAVAPPDVSPAQDVLNARDFNLTSPDEGTGGDILMWNSKGENTDVPFSLGDTTGNFSFTADGVTSGQNLGFSPQGLQQDLRYDPSNQMPSSSSTGKFSDALKRLLGGGGGGGGNALGITAVNMPGGQLYNPPSVTAPAAPAPVGFTPMAFAPDVPQIPTDRGGLAALLDFPESRRRLQQYDLESLFGGGA